MLIEILVLLLAFVILHYLNKPLQYWKEKKVKHIKPIPFVGNLMSVVTRQVSNTEFLQNCYRQFPDERYLGIWQFLSPVLIVKDPEIIKNITIKDFETFPEHRPVVSVEVDPLWSQNLFSIQGVQKWHQLRTILSPAYTTGKLKAMFTDMKKCTQSLLTHLQEKDQAIIEVELKDSFARMASDTLAITAFGVTSNTLSDPKSNFYKIIQELTDFSGIKGMLLVLNFLAPIVKTVFKIPVISKRISIFFKTLIKQSIQHRKNHGITRPDILQLLIEAQTTHKNSSNASEVGFPAVKTDLKLTDEIVTAQAIIYFFAGIDTVSTFISYTIYELALNLDIQNKLYAEITETFTESNEEISYDLLVQMKYLDMVVSEALRKWPPFVFFDRKACKPYTIQAKRAGDFDLTLETNSTVIFPVFAIHRDPKFYPNPDKFDPERFSDQNKVNLVPYTYIPFGVGPRNCIGSRFALLEGKLAVAEIVRNFEVVRISKTNDPIFFNKKNILPVPEDGIWVGLKKRI